MIILADSLDKWEIDSLHLRLCLGKMLMELRHDTLRRSLISTRYRNEDIAMGLIGLELVNAIRVSLHYLEAIRNDNIGYTLASA
jgi:hypothetical protein